MSSDFTGGFEYWPERRPCPNLVLGRREKQKQKGHCCFPLEMLTLSANFIKCSYFQAGRFISITHKQLMYLILLDTDSIFKFSSVLYR